MLESQIHSPSGHVRGKKNFYPTHNGSSEKYDLCTVHTTRKRWHSNYTRLGTWCLVCLGANGTIWEGPNESEWTHTLETTSMSHCSPGEPKSNRRWSRCLLSRLVRKYCCTLVLIKPPRFVAPYSYTTLPTVELHFHSGRAVISALLSSLSLLPTFRPAEPGEFTRQALLHGRLDLTQIEGLHDLIEADTEMQRIWALESAIVGHLACP